MTTKKRGRSNFEKAQAYSLEQEAKKKAAKEAEQDSTKRPAKKTAKRPAVARKSPAKTPTRSSNTNKSTASAKKSPEEENKSPSPEKVRPTKKRKTTNTAEEEQARAEAHEKAKRWAAEQEQQKAAKLTPIRKSTTETNKKQPFQSPGPAPVRTALQAPRVADEETTSDDELRTSDDEVRGPPQVSRSRFETDYGTLRSRETRKSVPATYNKSSASKSRPVRHSLAHPVQRESPAFGVAPSNQGHMLDNQDLEEIEEKPALSVMKAALGAVFGVMLLFFLVSWSQLRFASLGTPCYTNHADASFECGLSNNVHPCPFGAVCMNGELMSCGPHAQVEGNQCTLLEESQKQIDAIFDVIHRYNVKHNCDFYFKNPYHVSELMGRPMFMLEPVLEALQIPYSPGLLKAADHIFIVDDTEEQVLIGLHPSVPVKLTGWCHVKKFLYLMLKVVWGVVAVLYSYWYAFFQESPVATVFVTVVGFAILLGQDYTKRKNKIIRQFEATIVQSRDVAYEKLRGDPSAAKLDTHLKDDVALTLHPTSAKLRTKFCDDVWPHVANDMKKDSRIHFTRAYEHGIYKDYWQWVDTPGRSRVSFPQ